MYSFVIAKKIIYENQFGFRKGHALNLSVSLIESLLKDRKPHIESLNKKLRSACGAVFSA